MNAAPALPFALAESLVHTMDPYVVKFTEEWGIRWYGVAYLTGFVVAWVVVALLARARKIVLKPAQVGDFMTACVLGVVVGGRVGHVLFYDRQLLWTFHEGVPWWGLLDIQKGGMSSHGGMVGMLVAMLWMSRAYRLPYLALCDVVCFVAPPGLMFGRLANWVNGELPGKILPESMQAAPPWWSVKFPKEALETTAPAAREHIEHLVRSAYLGNAHAAQEVAALVPARYPSQFIQALTDGPILMAVLFMVWVRPRSQGALFGAFLVAYGILRVVSEQFREPDPGVLAYGPFTLPMLLSIAMVGAGAWLVMFACGRTQQVQVGGLLTPFQVSLPAR